MANNLIKHWQSLTTVDIQKLSESDPVAILPIAAIEQHGPHLPLSTDLDIGMGLLTNAFDCLPHDFSALVLPAQAVGCSLEHVHFHGTLSLEPHLLSETIVRNGIALANCGIKRLVLSNSHGGNRHSLDTAGLKLREEHKLLVVKANYFLFPKPNNINLPESEWKHGLHGGAIETAMMQHLRPDLVRSNAIKNYHSLGEDLEKSLTRLSPESEAASFSWLAKDLNRTGVAGDASLANPAIGKQLVNYYGQALAEVIRDAKDFPLEHLV